MLIYYIKFKNITTKVSQYGDKNKTKTNGNKSSWKLKNYLQRLKYYNKCPVPTTLIS